MIIKIDIKHAVTRLRMIRNNLSGKEWNTAIARSLTRAAQEGKTLASREVRKRYKITKRDLEGGGKSMGVRRASPMKLSATIFTWGKPISLREFKPKQVKKGVSVNILGTRKVFKHAFIATMPNKGGNDHRAVFARGDYAKVGFSHRVGIGKPRTKDNSYNDLGITKLVTLSQAMMIRNTSIVNKVQSKIEEAFNKRLVHEVDFIISKRILRGKK